MRVQVRNDKYYMNFSRQTFIFMNMIETLSICFMWMELGLYVVALPYLLTFARLGQPSSEWPSADQFRNIWMRVWMNDWLIDCHFNTNWTEYLAEVWFGWEWNERTIKDYPGIMDSKEKNFVVEKAGVSRNHIYNVYRYRPGVWATSGRDLRCRVHLVVQGSTSCRMGGLDDRVRVTQACRWSEQGPTSQRLASLLAHRLPQETLRESIW